MSNQNLPKTQIESSSSSVRRAVNIFFPDLIRDIESMELVHQFVFKKYLFEKDTFLGERVFKAVFEKIPNSEVEDAEDFIATLVGLRVIVEENGLSDYEELDSYLAELQMPIEAERLSSAITLQSIGNN